jgi:hypothetical protein
VKKVLIGSRLECCAFRLLCIAGICEGRLVVVLLFRSVHITDLGRQQNDLTTSMTRVDVSYRWAEEDDSNEKGRLGKGIVLVGKIETY